VLNSISFIISQEAKEELEQWLKTVAALLARLVCKPGSNNHTQSGSLSFQASRFGSLARFMALLIVVLYEARIRRQVLSFNRKTSQDELTKLANKLTSIYAGMTSSEILAQKEGLSAEEKQMSESFGRNYDC
jgi:transcriptional regulator of heat shock response